MIRICKYKFDGYICIEMYVQACVKKSQVTYYCKNSCNIKGSC